ncbi:transmembrane emp24 domain-containing protein 6-like [Acanthaster planci]|uniref:Transmembrane emp24 domain-containing protein 6-like n=1 Tax=Acanthaster planci TaxID=133434 RepID=A0A8B7YWM1_ACAPL|nr:transmembrane emp24 domain-containing protein 6-like [Acanthaster planci]
MIEHHQYVDPVDRQEPWISVSLKIVVEPGKEECFFQRVRTGMKFDLGYYATSQDVNTNLRVIIRSDRGERLYESYEELADHFNTVAHYDGLFTICFSNQASRHYAKKVSMAIDMYEETKVREYFRLKEEKEVLFGNASESLMRTWKHLWRASREQFILRQTTQRDEEFMANNADYILYWSVAQAIIIISAGVGQVLALRSLFNVKALTPTQKPRC